MPFKFKILFSFTNQKLSFIMSEEERDLVPEEAPLAKNVLTVKSVNLHILQNTKEHKTADYDCTERAKDPRLVVRRGQVFIMTLTFQRPWSSQDDDLFVQFSIGAWMWVGLKKKRDPL